ncbi:hypothetical protein HK405_006861 [Cladochytrium tenue]|nr:hypothetical protein HK405_006861 [Cladochytrium tenue]
MLSSAAAAGSAVSAALEHDNNTNNGSPLSNAHHRRQVQNTHHKRSPAAPDARRFLVAREADVGGSPRSTSGLTKDGVEDVVVVSLDDNGEADGHARDLREFDATDVDEGVRLDLEGDGPNPMDVEWDDGISEVSSSSSPMTHTEALLTQIAAVTEGMHRWRARVFFVVNSGNLLPLESLDVHLAHAALESLRPAVRAHLAALGCNDAKATVRLLLASKLLNWLFTAAIILSIAVLCTSSQSGLPTDTLVALLCMDLLCTGLFSVEIVLNAASLKRSPRRRVFGFVRSWVERLALDALIGRRVMRWLRRRARAEADNRLQDASKSRNVKSLEDGLISWHWVLLDIVAVFPSYVELVALAYEVSTLGGGFVGLARRMYDWTGLTSELRAFRILRILRLIKIVQKSEKLRFMIKAIANSTDGIWLLLYMIVLVVIFFSSVLFFVEQSGEYIVDGVWYYNDGTVSPFQSIISTGYGDVVPRTAGGKIVMSAVMIIAVFVIAFPLSMITLQYGHVISMFMTRKLAHERATQLARSRAASAAAPESPMMNDLDHKAATKSSAAAVAALSRWRDLVVSRIGGSVGPEVDGSADPSATGGADVNMQLGPVGLQMLDGGNAADSMQEISRDGAANVPGDDSDGGNGGRRDRLMALGISISGETLTSLGSDSAGLLGGSAAAVSVRWAGQPVNNADDDEIVAVGGDGETGTSSSEAAAAPRSPGRSGEHPRGAVPRSVTSGRTARAAGARAASQGTLTASTFVHAPHGVTMLEPQGGGGSGSRQHALSRVRGASSGGGGGGSSGRGVQGIREVERGVQERLGGSSGADPDGAFPSRVVLRVAEWGLEYDAGRREDVLRMRVECRDAEAYRRLMRALAELE